MMKSAFALDFEERAVRPLRLAQRDTMVPDLPDMENPTHLNAFLYAGADPVNNWDPSGHDWSLASLTVGLGIQAGLIGLSVPVIAGITSHESGGSFGVGFYNSLFAGAAFFFITAKDGGVESPKFWNDVTSVLVQTTMAVGFEALGTWSRDPANFSANFGPQEVNDTFWKNFNTYAESTAYNIGYDSPTKAAIATAATSFIQKSPGLIASVSHNLYDIFTGQQTDWEDTGKLFVSDTIDATISGYKSFVNNGLPAINDLPDPIKALAKSLVWGGVDSLRRAISKL